jgi:flavin-dependent dehydrogenase
MRVVVIGAGMAGLVAALTPRVESGGAIDVTVVDKGRSP